MRFYIVTFHETDGNDVTVFDALVSADSEDTAVSRVADSIEASLKENGTEYTEDGNALGYYFECSEDCGEMCEGHGGIALRTVEAYDSEDEARQNMARYHSEWTVN